MGPAFVLLAFGALTVVLSLELRLGTLRAPDSGFFPFVLGVMLMALAAGHLVQLRLAARQAPSAAAAPGVVTAEDRAAIRRVLAFIGVAVLATALLEPLGYAAVACLLMAALLEILGLRPRWATAAIAVVTASVCQILFVHWLRIPLPAGWFWP